VQIAFILLGYAEDLESTDKMSPALKANLVRYQKENKLPIGQLTIETLKHLGI
jgi:hypothetical protein